MATKRPKIVVQVPDCASWMGELVQRFPQYEFLPSTGEPETIDALPDTVALVLNGEGYTPELASAIHSKAGALRWIQSTSVGSQGLHRLGLPPGVVATDAKGLKGPNVAEHAMALLLGIAHDIPFLERARHVRNWSRDVYRRRAFALEGRLMLIFGYGSIGQDIARKARAFDMRVVAVNRTGNSAGTDDLVVNLAGARHHLPDADVVMLALPDNPSTQGLMDREMLRSLKPGCVVINVGRGNTIDQDELERKLGEGSISAGLDVVRDEPLPPSDGLWSLENVVISPHSGGFIGNSRQRLATLMGDNILRLEKGLPLLNQIQLG